MRGVPLTDEKSERHLALKVVMMPRDTNQHGTIFGGVILSYIDQAGAVGAYHEMRRIGASKKPLVTVGMKSVAFHRPVFVGDLLSFWTKLERIGTTSITIRVEVEADREDLPVKLTEAEVSYVAVSVKDESRFPVPIKYDEVID